MAEAGKLTRRGLLLGGAAAFGAAMLRGRPASAQVTDLRGWDPLWHSAEAAIEHFFGDVPFLDRDGIEMVLPQHADVGSSVPLTLKFPGEIPDVPHPVVLHVMAHGNPTPHVLSAFFYPGSGRAEFSTRIRLERSQRVTAVAQMSDGRYRRSDRDITVSFGACGQVGTGTNDDVLAFRPVSRVSVPKMAKRGEIIPVRALISHPQETGLRLDVGEEWVRERIISNFACLYNGVEVFRVRPYAAVATNPYFAFFVRAADSGVFDFSWYDTQDFSYANQASITVT